MYLVPLVVLAIAGFVVFKVVQHRAHPAGAGGHPAHSPTLTSASFWPTTLKGKLGIGAFALSFLPMLLVNVVQIPYLSAAVLLAAVVLTGVARFGEHDRSTSVLIAFGVSAVAMVAGLLFLAGEVLIGHD